MTVDIFFTNTIVFLELLRFYHSFKSYVECYYFYIFHFNFSSGFCNFVVFVLFLRLFSCYFFFLKLSFCLRYFSTSSLTKSDTFKYKM